MTKNTTPAKRYNNLTPLMILQLAAPHTWSAAIMPVLLSACIAAAGGAGLSVVMFVVLLAICVLMQSAVNTLNDYMDYVKGADTVENQLDPTDAVLVYNNVNPKQVLALVVLQLVLSFALGIYVILQTSWITLAIGLAGLAVLVFYSVGKVPLSYLPLGEFASGFTMGGLETLACTYALTGTFSWYPLLVSVPLMCTIGLINFTNNTCDIEKDIEADRKTLSVHLGRPKARRAYKGLLFTSLALMCVLVAVFYTPGLVVCACMLAAGYPLLKALCANPLVLQSRGPAMAQAVSVNITFNVFYDAAILFGSCAVLL
ncbi:MAG: prenyltransferase [Coriobacteriia bacterium]|nr:prenyltransferase [Coriobacteriia bacterium]